MINPKKFEFSLMCIILLQVVEELESKMRDLEMKKGKEIRVYEDKLRYQEERHKEALSLLHLECEKKVSFFPFLYSQWIISQLFVKLPFLVCLFWLKKIVD